jgi:hypothetical protein
MVMIVVCEQNGVHGDFVGFVMETHACACKGQVLVTLPLAPVGTS